VLGVGKQWGGVGGGADSVIARNLKMGGLDKCLGGGGV